MDAGQWSEGSGVVKPMEEKKSIRPQALNCPRCNSSHTKFCYYNNYSLSQPRFFCKTCRRYWTNGGSLRNVPVGGGSRRNKRSSGAGASASLKNQQPSKTIAVQSQGQSQVEGQGHDLTLGGRGYANISLQFGNLPYNPNTTASTQFSATDGFADPRDVIMNSPAAGLNYSFNEFENGVGYHHHLQAQGVVTNHESNISDATANERILFPFQGLNPMSNSKSEILGATRDSSTGYWGTQGLGGGSSW